MLDRILKAGGWAGLALAGSLAGCGEYGGGNKAGAPANAEGSSPVSTSAGANQMGGSTTVNTSGGNGIGAGGGGG